MPSPVVLTRSSPTRVLSHKMFNRDVKALQRGRVVNSSSSGSYNSSAAMAGSSNNPGDKPNSPHSLGGGGCDLHRLVAEQMLERRSFIKRKTPVVLEIGAHTGWYFRHMMEKRQYFGIKQYIQTDISEDRLNQNYEEIKDLIPDDVEFIQICCDEETDQAPNPFGIPERSVDMVVSCLSAHWINDLETAMVSARRTLKKDSCMLLSMFGGNTLYELRSAFSLSMNEVHGGVGTHVSPMIDGAGISSLMLQSGFNLPSVDMDRHVLMYKSPFHVMEHVQAMGESACHIHRRALDRTTLACMGACYQNLYEKNTLVPASFEIFHAVAWSPGPDQPRPLQRGAGAVPLSAVASSDHKELQSVLEEYSRNPADTFLAEKAEEILSRMRSRVDDDHAQLGLGHSGEGAQSERSANSRSSPVKFQEGVAKELAEAKKGTVLPPFDGANSDDGDTPK